MINIKLLFATKSLFSLCYVKFEDSGSFATLKIIFYLSLFRIFRFCTSIIKVINKIINH